MTNPYVFITSDIEGGYSPYQALQGTDSYYTLDDSVNSETLTVTFNAEDEPEFTQFSFYGENVDSFNVKIWRKGGYEYVEFTDQNMVRIHYETMSKQYTDCILQLHISKLNIFTQHNRTVLASDENPQSMVWSNNETKCIPLYTPVLLHKF